MHNLLSLIRTDRPFVIAEIGNNHEGDIGVARDLIYAAKESGVDSVKFQAIVPSSLVSADQKQRINQLDKFCLGLDGFQELSELAESLGLIFFTSVFDIELVDKLAKIQKVFKVSSGDNTYFDLIDRIAGTMLPTIISTGGLKLDEIDVLRSQFFSSSGVAENLALLHCVSNYPTLPENAQLSMIDAMQKRYPDVTIGYSDHTLGNNACYLAAGLGAKIIEKHFTMSHTFSEFRDHQLSADPKQMTELMKVLPEAYSLAGHDKTDLERNDASMTGVRRKAIASRDVVVGEAFSLENIEWLRITEDSGLSDRSSVYGKVAKIEVSKGDIIMPEDMQG
jgi:N,N'-diacetyllegionaminate synthase